LTRLKLVLIILITLILINQQITIPTSYCQNNIIAYSKGSFNLTLKTNLNISESSIKYIDYRAYGRISPGVYENNITYTEKNPSQRDRYYNETIVIYSDKGVLNATRWIQGFANSSNTSLFSKYLIELRENTIVLSDFYMEIATSDPRVLLDWNLTLNEVLLYHGKYRDIRFNNSLNNGLRVLTVEIDYYELDYSEFDDQSLRDFTGLPIDIDHRLILTPGFKKLIAVNTIRDSILSVYRYIESSMIDPSLLIQSDLYALSLKPFLNETIVLSSAVYTRLLNATWSIVVNDSLNTVEINAYGSGKGVNDVEKVKSILVNSVELAKLYGCIVFKATGFKIKVNGVEQDYLVIHGDTTLDNIEIVFENRVEKTSGFDTYLLFINIILAIVIIVLILLYRLKRRR